MKSLLSDGLTWACRILAALALVLLSGCIADSAEDADLPWSTNQNWEGLGPIGSMINDR